MFEYDVWFVHDYYSVYVSVEANDGAEAQIRAEDVLSEQEIPWFTFTQANDILVERK